MLNATEHIELVNDFIDQLGVSETTATIATNLFLAVTTSVDGEQAQQQEFERALQQSVAQGESWATEMVTKVLEKRLPEFRTTYQRALERGQEPSTALVREHALPPEAANELIALLSQAPANEEPRREQRESPSAQPMLADISSFSGEVTVTVDPAATVASAKVYATETSGPCADAARNATIRLVGDRLTVSVPEPEPTVIGDMTFRGGTVFQNVSYVGPGQTMTGVTIDGNGNMHVGGVTGGSSNSSTIKIDVTLPPGSGVRLRGHNLHLTVHGPLAALDTKTHNGNLRAGVLGRAKLRSHNGNSSIDAIQVEIDSDTHNGTTTIGSYSGSYARLNSHNGGMHLTASRQAQGDISASTHNGSIVLHGVSGRSDLNVSTSKYHGHVTKT